MTTEGAFRYHRERDCPETRARLGHLITPHGRIDTPAFMPVGTAASVKGVDPEQVEAAGCQVLLCNTYHLALRPGDALIRDLGGLHRFMGWPHPILTDSGGYQVFSLSELTEVDDDGVTFRSHLDGEKLRLTPERACEIQLNLGADIIMSFDECLPHDADRATVEASLERRTHPWEERCLALHPRDGRALFAIGQGGLHADLRRRSLEHLCQLDFDGFALGGLSVGETKEQMADMISVSTEIIPVDRPRYLMGVGTVPEILEAVSLGIDMFDCVLPTRNARNANAFTFRGSLRLKNARFKGDPRPLEADCPCPTCSRGFSRAYLRHLLMAKELLGPTLMTLHNLWFMQRLMTGLRQALAEDRFPAFRRTALAATAGEAE